MTSAEIRNDQWRKIQKRLSGDCLKVHRAFQTHGPATTLDLASCAEISPWSVRPRTTQLLQMGLVQLVGRQDREGVYAAVDPQRALEDFVAQHVGGGEQMLFRM